MPAAFAHAEAALSIHFRAQARLLQEVVIGLPGLRTVLADAPQQSLGDDAIDGRGHGVGIDAHMAEALDDIQDAVGMYAG
ncbi:hypothetical protein FQZ97_571160 [compost metagenome]